MTKIKWKEAGWCRSYREKIQDYPLDLCLIRASVAKTYAYLTRSTTPQNQMHSLPGLGGVAVSPSNYLIFMGQSTVADECRKTKIHIIWKCVRETLLPGLRLLAFDDYPCQGTGC